MLRSATTHHSLTLRCLTIFLDLTWIMCASTSPPPTVQIRGCVSLSGRMRVCECVCSCTYFEASMSFYWYNTYLNKTQWYIKPWFIANKINFLCMVWCSVLGYRTHQWIYLRVAWDFLLLIGFILFSARKIRWNTNAVFEQNALYIHMTRNSFTNFHIFNHTNVVHVKK